MKNKYLGSKWNVRLLLRHPKSFWAKVFAINWTPRASSQNLTAFWAVVFKCNFLQITCHVVRTPFAWRGPYGISEKRLQVIWNQSQSDGMQNKVKIDKSMIIFNTQVKVTFVRYTAPMLKFPGLDCNPCFWGNGKTREWLSWDGLPWWSSHRCLLQHAGDCL